MQILVNRARTVADQEHQKEEMRLMGTWGGVVTCCVPLGAILSTSPTFSRQTHMGKELRGKNSRHTQ